MNYLIPVLALVLICCGTSGNQESENSSSEIVSQNKSCLGEMTDPVSWLSLSTAATLAKVPETEIEQKIYKPMNTCQYNWKSDRTYTMKIGNAEMKVDANNVIAISVKNLDEEIKKWLEKKYVKKTEMSYVEYFDQFHGAVTEEDKNEVNKKLDEKAKRDEDFDAKSAETAKGLLALSKTENFTELNDLGDKANYYIQLAPNLRELRLAVLSGNVVLSIVVDVSDNDSDDLSTARAVAEAVMANCK